MIATASSPPATHRGILRSSALASGGSLASMASSARLMASDVTAARTAARFFLVFTARGV